MSSDYKIKISEPCAMELRRQAETAGITVNTMMTQILEERVTLVPSIDVAAGVFLSHLEPEHQKLILDCAAETQRSPAAYIMSYIQRAHDQGATALPIAEALDPSLHQPLSLPNGATMDVVLCEWCQRPIPTPYVGQRYCPAPPEGESCGRQAALAAIRAARQKTSDSTIPAPHIIEHHVKV